MRRVALLLVAVALAGAVPGAATAAGCTGPAAAFAGVIYDSAKREDFQRDVDHFQGYVHKLRGRYCLPQSSVRIYAFENYSRNGTTYPHGSEANIKAALADLGAAAHADPTLTTFVMLSSHGSFYSGAECDGVGSYAALKEGGGEDGRLYDCELGSSLNAAFPPGARIVVVVDCSFCGGFSDSVTAASGTARDDALTVSSGIPAPGRIVLTGCAITTECFGGSEGGVFYEHLTAAMNVGSCDGHTAPAFPSVQGVNVPTRTLAPDGACSVSEWFFAAVWHAYLFRDVIAIQEQFRIKYGLSTLAEDYAVL